MGSLTGPGAGARAGRAQASKKAAALQSPEQKQRAGACCVPSHPLVISSGSSEGGGGGFESDLGPLARSMEADPGLAQVRLKNFHSPWYVWPMKKTKLPQKLLTKRVGPSEVKCFKRVGGAAGAGGRAGRRVRAHGRGRGRARQLRAHRQHAPVPGCVHAHVLVLGHLRNCCLPCFIQHHGLMPCMTL
jgi:hypothetical protein